MKIPDAPQIDRLPSISPTLFESARVCMARAAYQRFSDRSAILPHPSQLLGIVYHQLMEDATFGRIRGDGIAERVRAGRALFDAAMERLYASSHPLLRAKFQSAVDLPHYALFRERASQKGAAIAAEFAEDEGAGSSLSLPRDGRVESELFSRDGQVRGRPDLVLSSQRSVVDYKAGSATGVDADGLKDSEKRQLLLYGYLLAENGIVVDKGIIERGNGLVAQLAISVEASELVADAARTALAEFNEVVPMGLEALATPSSLACAGCNAKPQCGAFWKAAREDWADEVGIHAEGLVTDINTTSLNGVEVATMRLEIEAGTVRRGSGAIEQVPVIWMLIGAMAPPASGDRLRIVDAKLAIADPVVLRADKTMTAVWGPI